MCRFPYQRLGEIGRKATWIRRRGHIGVVSEPKQNADVLDEKFDWGVTVGFHNEPDGSQAPDYARVSRWRFETTITTTRMASDFFGARTKCGERTRIMVGVNKFVDIYLHATELSPDRQGWQRHARRFHHYVER